MVFGRLVDVEVNRACEGLRVVEDLLRFVYENDNLSLKVKELRHRIRVAFSGFESYRSSDRDVGKGENYDLRGEKKVKETLLSNLKRAEESMRVIEETSGKFRSEAKSFRFEIYSLESLILRRLFLNLNLTVYLITPDGLTSDELFEVLNKVLIDGVGVLQLRRKNLKDRELFYEASVVSEICRKKGVSFIINDRPDIAHLVGADGVHLGDDDVPVDRVRDVFPELKIGATAQTPEMASRLEVAGADYVGCGAVYPSPTKQNRKVIGPAGLRKVVEAVSIPVVAIGGITPDNLESVFKAGASGIAVLSYVFNSDSPDKRVAEIVEKVQELRRL